MRYSKFFPKTRREDPRDASSPGTRLLVRAGFIHSVGAGIWSWTPLGLMVRRKAETIVREEMNRTGAMEVELPILQAQEFWDETDRWDKYQRAGISFCVTDRKGARYMLAPTAEELVTEYARSYLQSHRDLPATFWQMSPKYRDELRPRQGLVRCREFLMKDAYSFGRNEDDMRQAYQQMAEAYDRVFQRAGFNFIKVEADSGAIGGSGSAEFMAVTEYGEDVLLHCPACGYGANQEKAATVFHYDEVPMQDLERIDTPNIRTVEELENFIGLAAAQMVKTIVLVADEQPVIVSMRGDLEISEVKLANLLGADVVETAHHSIVEEITRAPVGFAGPINLANREVLFEGSPVPYFFDRSVEGLRNFLCGGNEEDVHYVGVNTGRDFPAPQEYHDLSKVQAGMCCPQCHAALTEAKGIELGHIFQLQQVYSEPMNAVYVDADGNTIPYWMGCYGIGVSRMVQAIAEQNYDDMGIIWPKAMAPFQAVVIPVNDKMHTDAESIYHQLACQFPGEIMFEDRGERFGVAITDAELIGYPIQVIVGRAWSKEKKVEVRLRDHRDKGEYFDKEKNPALKPVDMDIQSLASWMRLQRSLNGNNV